MLIDRKKSMAIFTFIFIFLMNSILAFSVDISECRSDNINWLCERGEPCVCKISDSCTNGNLLVYEEDINDFLCSPQISSASSTIDWSVCETFKDHVRIRADCDEGQSSEKMIIITSGSITTTTQTTTTIEGTTSTTTIYGGGCGTNGYCEYEAEECREGYEECLLYSEECYDYEKCCCPVYEDTTTTLPDREDGFSYGWIVGIIIIVAIAIIAYFFFMKRGSEKEIKNAFRDLYEKWAVV